MLSLFGSRSRAVFACVALTVSVLFMLALASHANAAYLVPNFTVTAAPTQAAGHPKITVSIDPDAAKADSTGGDDLKDLTIDAPAGFQLNQAAATTKCTDSTFTGSGNCPSASQVGTATIKWRRSFISTVTFTGKVYVLTTPADANTAALGLVLKATGFKTQAIRATVSDALPVNAPTRVSLTGITRTIKSSIGLNLSATIDKIDVVLNAKANSSQNGPYFTLNPSSCTAATTQATLTSYANVVVDKSSSYVPSGCSTVKFTPTATVTPTVTNIVAPTGLNTSFTVPGGELTTQQSAVKSITIATPNGVLLNYPALAAVVPCPEANLAADTCPAASKIGTTSFTFWGASAAPGDIYLTAHTAPGFELGAVSRGANGVRAITRGSVAQIDSDGDGNADNLRVNLDSLPTATWTAASLNISSLLLRNNCPTGPVTTTIQSASASTVVLSGTWLLGICDPVTDTTITSGPSGYTNLTTPQFAFTGTPAGATFDCQLDGASFTTCASPLTTPAQSQGSHTFCVRAVGPMGPDPSPACRTFTVDTVAPTVNIFSNGPSISFTAADASPIASFTCTLNSNPAVACTSPWIIPVFDDASYSFTICATDAAGNTGCATRVVDVVPPQTTITSGPSGYVASPNATFAFTATEPNVLFTCSLDGAAFTACSSPQTFTGLSQGSHTFCVRATDAAGNVYPTPTCRSWTVDTIAPVVTFTTPLPPPNPSSMTVSWTIQDASPIVSVTCRLDGSAAAACTSPLSLTGLSSGPHTFSVCATDAAGNTGCGTINWSVPPPSFTVSITSGPPSVTTSSSASFTFTSSTGGVTFECSLDGAAFAACVSPRNLTGLAFGTHTFCVRGSDGLGNPSSNTDCRTWVIETDPGVVTITGGPSGISTTVTVTFTFTFPQPGWIYECQLDGGAWMPCLSPISFTGLTMGTHTFCVRAVNETGVTPPTCRTWLHDPTPPPPPNLTRTPSANPTNSTAATITITPGDSGGTLQGSLDGAPFTSVASPVQLTGLANGAHTYSARQVDAAGNVGGTTTIVWTVDTVPPTTPTLTRTSPISSPTSQTTASFTFTGGEAGLTFQASLDAGGFAAATSPTNLTGLSGGAHTYSVRAIDAAGNISAPASNTWIVDGGPVQPVFTSGPSGTVASTTAAFTFTGIGAGGAYECRLDDGEWYSCVTPTTWTGLTQGSHTFCFRVVDSAGNIGPEVCRTWTVDTVAPSISAQVQPGTNPVISFTVNDASPISSVTCRVDGGATTACASPWQLPAVPPGSHVVQICATDAAGNVGCISITWTTSGGGPFSVSITSGPPSVTLSPTATFTYVASEVLYLPNPCAPGTPVCVQVIVPKVNLDCSVDGGSYFGCPTNSQYGGSYTTPAMSPGPHTFCVRGTRIDDGAVSTECRSWSYQPTPPVVTITSPANGSSTTATSTTLNYTTSGFGGPPSCSPANGATIPLTMGANSIVVDCADPSTGQSAIATVSITRNALGTFAPTYEHTFLSDSSSLDTGLSFSINNPAGSDPVKTALIKEPVALLASYDAFGLPSDICPSNTLVSTGPTTSVFSRANCPDAAKVGQVTLDSPDYAAPLHGNVWLVDRTALPWFAVDFLDPALGNPTNIALPQMVARTGLEQADPLCDPSTDPAGYCANRITFLLTGIPEVSALQLDFTIDGPPRAGSSTLSGKLFHFDGVCDTVSTSARLVPVAGSAITLNSPMVLPPCSP